MADLQRQIDAYNAEIVNSYLHLKQKAYYLHSICVHEGSAESGHYYTFIKDQYSGNWLQFNDFKVSWVDEKTVFEVSDGGYGVASAYWVVYQSAETIEQAR